MTPPAGAATRLFAVLGDPVSHSLSPTFQNAALRALGLDGVYVALRCSADDLPGLVRALARAGGGGNVTVPHKELAACAVERRTTPVDATGACNTFWLEDGQVCGDNTDVEGFTEATRVLLGASLADARVLLLGAGGSARAVACACATHGAERVAVLNRSPDRARDLARRFADSRTRFDVVSSPADLDRAGFDLVVNATSLGLKADDALPLGPSSAPPLEAALDLVYNRTGDTAWTKAMRAHGVPASDGTEMLLAQGAAAFRRWWNVDPPIDAMRSALRQVTKTEESL